MTDIYYMFFLFFFQAEDGIRDLYVTGVQTCALPICHRCTARVMAVIDQGRRVAGGRRRREVRIAVSGTRRAFVAEAEVDRKSVVLGKSVDLGGRRVIREENIE